ncbi:MAG: DUF4325 domain-containing protein [Coriobacteriia bacterium]|nr:DUF4325 domain-containing protein [Coriobacteriia bacterium]
MESELVSVKDIARGLGLSTSRVRQLADEGVIPSLRTPGGHRRFDPVAVRLALARCRLPAVNDSSESLGLPSFEQDYSPAGLEEHVVWREVSSALQLSLQDEFVKTMQYAFSEMMNNAIEHSEGDSIRVSVWSTAALFAFEICDDGVGAFAKLAAGLSLPDPLAAVQELTKGKRTTDPVNHTGQGIFFTSKAVDLFQLSANGVSWLVDNLREDQAVGVSERVRGTCVFCRISPLSDRSIRGLFERYSIDYEFARTRTIVKLFEMGVSFVSRSEARRLMAGLESFREIEMDFKGVETVGQGFVDEVFRVWQGQHPGVRIIPVNMSREVEFMVKRGLASSS